MKPEPLKDCFISYTKTSIGGCFDAKDIASAVNWLKECIYNNNWEAEIITKSKVTEIIDEDFNQPNRKEAESEIND